MFKREARRWIKRGQFNERFARGVGLRIHAFNVNHIQRDALDAFGAIGRMALLYFNGDVLRRSQRKLRNQFGGDIGITGIVGKTKFKLSDARFAARGQLKNATFRVHKNQSSRHKLDGSKQEPITDGPPEVPSPICV